MPAVFACIRLVVLVHLIVWGDVFHYLTVKFHRRVRVLLCPHREVHLVIPTHELHLRLEVWLFAISYLNLDAVFRVGLYVSGKRISRNGVLCVYLRVSRFGEFGRLHIRVILPFRHRGELLYQPREGMDGLVPLIIEEEVSARLPRSLNLTLRVLIGEAKAVLGLRAEEVGIPGLLVHDDTAAREPRFQCHLTALLPPAAPRLIANVECPVLLPREHEAGTLKGERFHEVSHLVPFVLVPVLKMQGPVEAVGS